MNEFYESFDKIVFGIIARHIHDLWVEIALAVLFAFLAPIAIHFANRYSRKYAPLKLLQQAKERYHKSKMEKELDKILKGENREKYRKKLIENALEKAKSIDESERETGLEQIVQFGKEDTYEELSDILKNTKLTKSHEMQIIDTLHKLKNMNKR